MLWKKTLRFIMLLVLGTSVCSVSAESDDGPLFGIFTTAQEKFDGLSPKGKFAVGAAGGFVATRIVLGSAMTAIKVGAVAFITAEVLHQTGVLDVRDMVGDFKESDLGTKMKVVASNYADSFRTKVRGAFHPGTVQRLFEKERMAALGGASGAVVGLLL